MPKIYEVTHTTHGRVHGWSILNNFAQKNALIFIRQKRENKL